ncbi:hypothetical protein ACTOVL_05920 [Arcanobacterium canis]
MENTENTQASNTDKAPAQEKETDWKAQARKWETRAKENHAAALKLAELEEAAKTEGQKRTEKIAALEAKVASYEKRDQVTAWAKEIVKDSHVPADVLRGDTREELQAHFDQLTKLVTPSKPAKKQVFPGYEKEAKTPNETAWVRDFFASYSNNND